MTKSPAAAQRALLPRWLAVIFFASGFAALLYQVVWQRALYTIFGVNIESVTIVVTAFLVGLGAGSFVGGALAARAASRELLIFGCVEMGIAAFGCVSLQFFHRAGEATLIMPGWLRASVSFSLVLLPTILMGATLPLLVGHSVRRSGNVGRSVGILYCVNTAGSAAAALVAVLVLLGALGESGTVGVAVLANVGVAGVSLVQYRRLRGVQAP